MKKILKTLWKVVKYFLIIIVILSIGISIFVNLHPVFGGGAKSFEDSQNFSDGKFKNLVKTATMTENPNDDTTILEGIKNMVSPPEGKNPKKPLPSKAFDKNYLQNGDIVWLGHATILAKINDTVIITDPVFNRASPIPIFGKPFEYEHTISVEDLPEIDIVLISHDHYDHLDYKAILELAKKTKTFLVPLGNKSHLTHWGIDANKIIEKDWYQSEKISDIDFSLVPSRHFSGRAILNGNTTLWGGWIIASENKKMYFSGDTGYFDEFKKIGEEYGPFDIAFIDTGAYDAAWAHVHMMPEESVQASIDLQAKVYLPIGWSKFDLANHSWEEPVERASKEAGKKNIDIATPLIGEVFSLDDIPRENWWSKLSSK